MPARVVFTPEGDAQLVDLYRHIAREASPAAAERFTGEIVDYWEGFETFPMRRQGHGSVLNKYWATLM